MYNKPFKEKFNKLCVFEVKNWISDFMFWEFLGIFFYLFSLRIGNEFIRTWLYEDPFYISGSSITLKPRSKLHFIPF